MGTINTLPVWDQIEALYLGYTGRDATDTELFGPLYERYDRLVSSGETSDEALYKIADELAQRPASHALYPLLAASLADPASPDIDHNVAVIVDQVWADIFGHRPSSGASAYWENRVLSGAVGLSELPARIENRAHGADAAAMLDHVHAAVEAATYTSGGAGISAVSASPTPGVIIQLADGSGEFTGGGLLAEVAPVANFVTGSTAAATVANFSVAEYGLTGGTLAVGSVAANVDAVIGAQTAGSNVAANVTLVEITDQSFANASALATALEGSEHLIFSGAPAGGASHVLVAYNDGTGSTRIANVGVMGSSPDTHFDAVTGSDLVQLIGVSVTSLAAHNIHFLA